MNINILYVKHIFNQFSYLLEHLIPIIFYIWSKKILILIKIKLKCLYSAIISFLFNILLILICLNFIYFLLQSIRRKVLRRSIHSINHITKSIRVFSQLFHYFLLIYYKWLQFHHMFFTFLDYYTFRLNLYF